MNKKIDLTQLTKGEVRNLTGQDRGKAARQLFELDILDKDSEMVTVIVPPELDAITTSFFQGMFSASVRSAKTAEKFLAKYHFETNASIMEQIIRGIQRVLTPRGTALG
ncbi:hypothetical protein [Hyphococcus sp. DH-69]|uniref:hypothetical protein n=1 Tax=Hyphococcus formosus TaxID=3143534 RepID=UPI00398B5CC5